ncbi:ABC transporter ATP-binding protein [Caenimonas soli]|uniref:ABC transporter ATP-binding protein n=1 Tax=Caenimonas soli TaxID=2735555 RepID=UPI001551DE87|nr:ABC transporter ATP-binding protein [Caenimonas soli]NPC58240.1 ABC transporter ATP-binding protein [Caenimonas soli]
MSAQPDLVVQDLRVTYGQVVAVQGFNLHLRQGEAVSVLGTNGAGKTSCVEGIIGLQARAAGSVHFEGEDISRLAASAVTRRGIALVPQGRELFSNFTVEETLAAGRRGAGDRKPLPSEEVYELFPRLAERRGSLAGNLSGGEQQMLAIGRALVTRPKALILDELSAGLSQGVVAGVIGALKRIRASGLMLIVVEQNLDIAEALTDDCIVLSAGREAWRGPVRTAVSDSEVREKFFR